MGGRRRNKHIVIIPMNAGHIKAIGPASVCPAWPGWFLAPGLHLPPGRRCPGTERARDLPKRRSWGGSPAAGLGLAWARDTTRMSLGTSQPGGLPGGGELDLGLGGSPGWGSTEGENGLQAPRAAPAKPGPPDWGAERGVNEVKVILRVTHVGVVSTYQTWVLPSRPTSSGCHPPQSPWHRVILPFPSQRGRGLA